MSKLVCLSGMNKGDQFPLHEGKNVIGRSSDCSIVLFDKKCSRQHCLVFKRDHNYSIKDLDSHNGTLVDGKHLAANKTTHCKVGALIQLGDTVLKLSEKAVGGIVDQEATDVAAELQGGKYDKLLKNASLNLARGGRCGTRRTGIANFFRRLFSRRK